MNRENLLTLLEQVEKAVTEQSALCRNRGDDVEAGKVLHAIGNALFMARNRLRQRWRRVWYKPWTWR